MITVPLPLLGAVYVVAGLNFGIAVWELGRLSPHTGRRLFLAVVCGVCWLSTAIVGLLYLTPGGRRFIHRIVGYEPGKD